MLCKLKFVFHLFCSHVSSLSSILVDDDFLHLFACISFTLDISCTVPLKYLKFVTPFQRALAGHLCNLLTMVNFLFQVVYPITLST